MLDKRQFSAVPVYSLPELARTIQNIGCMVVIMDIDTIRIDNRTVHDLALKRPGIGILCLSKNRFHLHLKESFSNYIYACISKPVVPDERFYCLKSICENQTDSKHKSED